MVCVAPMVFDKGRRVVPCGHCYSCLSNRRNDWTFRLRKEAKNAKTSFFITLTIDPDNDVNYGNVSKLEVQLFFKRFRKVLGDVRFRYYLVAEYGSTNYRPHYHMLAFFDDYVDVNKLREKLNKCWKKGFNKVDPVNEARIHYVTSYHITKSFTPDGLTPTFVLMSRNPGIGNCYLEKNRRVHKKRKTVTFEVGGFRKKIPRYYIDKMYSKIDKELIGLEAKKIGMQRFEQKINNLMALNGWTYGRAHSYLQWQNLQQKQKIIKIVKNKKL